VTGTVVDRGPVLGLAQRWANLPWALLLGVTIVIWLALARLAWAFVGEQFDWRYVAEQSRVGAPLPYRLAGVWAGMEGSLLLFAGILAVAATVAARRASTAARWGALVTVVTVTAIDLLLASPFGRLDIPAVRGFGMNPILEHPAMTIHPPLLYTGLATALGAAIVAVGTPAPWRTARPWLLATVGALTAAMTLGAAWSYLEQGWGGYWAWDPVENTSLLVWLAALAALHGGPLARPRTVVAMAVAPWLLATIGSVLVRSGVTPSIHGFAEQRAVGWALAGLTVATIAAVVLAVARTKPGEPPETARRDPRPLTVVLVAAAAIVVLAGTVLPLLTDLTGDRSTAVRGEFYSRTVGPLALVAVPFIAARLRRWDGWSTVAHAGALVLVVGIAASTFDRVATVAVGAGETVRAAGRDVLNDGVRVTDGARAGTAAVVADLRVDGRRMRPALVVHPDRGGRLAEVSATTGPVTDVQVVLEDASDDGTVVVTVHVRRVMWLVWLGATARGAVTIAGHACAPAARRVSAPALPLLRARAVEAAAATVRCPGRARRCSGRRRAPVGRPGRRPLATRRWRRRRSPRAPRCG
jgi:cytochrome c-type biogenesis protein NrfE